MQSLDRSAALVVAFLAVLGVVLQHVVDARALGSFRDAFLFLSQYFTILTNLLVAAAMIGVFWGRRLPEAVYLALSAAMVGLGIVYHALLAAKNNPQGLGVLSDLLMHTLAPLALVLWWFAFSDGATARFRSAFVAMVWPGLYCLAALIRAGFTGVYPYFFLDLPKLGLGQLIVNIIGLALLFTAIAALLLILARGLVRLRPTR